MLTAGLIDAVHRAGKQVHIWTVDDSETMERLIDLGVDGIFTDRIDILKDVLIAARPVDRCRDRTGGPDDPRHRPMTESPASRRCCAWALWDWGSSAYNTIVITLRLRALPDRGVVGDRAAGLGCSGEHLAGHLDRASPAC